MINFTPEEYRVKYDIYPSFDRLDFVPEERISALKLMFDSIGRSISDDKGDSLKINGKD